MRLEKYSDKYYDMIVEWQERRGEKFVDNVDIPKHGLVVDDIACGFLFCTDSAVGLIDYFISNPEATPIARAKALDKILENLIIWAKELGMSRIIATVKIPGTKKLALKHKFIDCGEYSFLTRGL